jgi:hypothetical protein
MPSFSDFIGSTQNKEQTSVSVNDVLASQSKGGVDVSEEDTKDKKSKDITDMLLSAEKRVENEMKTFSNADAVKELSALNKNFSAYADNLSMMKFYLSKFSDSTVEIGHEDAVKLQELVDQNDRLVIAINTQRKGDKEFNDKLLSVEREREFNFRSQGIMQTEQARMQKRYNLTTSELWNNIGEEMETQAKQTKEDVKTGLIEGIGGPLGTMVRKVVVPGFKAIKETTLGQKLGDKANSVGDKLKGYFIKNAADQKELTDVMNGVSGEIQQGSENTLKIEDDVNTSVRTSSNDIQGDLLMLEESTISGNNEIRNVTKDTLEETTKEIVAPSAGMVKKKTLLEANAQKAIPNKKPDGVFSKIQEGISQSNVLLKDIVMGLKDQKSTLDDTYTTLAEVDMLNSELVKMSESEAQHVYNSASEQEKLLSNISTSVEMQGRKQELVSRFNSDVFNFDKEMAVSVNEDNKVDEKKQVEILHELETLNSKDFGGGSMTQGMLNSVMGNGLKAMLPMLGTLGIGALVAAAVAGSGWVIYENIRRVREHPEGTGYGAIKNKWEEIRPLTAKEKAARDEAAAKLKETYTPKQDEETLKNLEKLQTLTDEEKLKYYDKINSVNTGKSKENYVTDISNYKGDMKNVSDISKMYSESMSEKTLTALVEKQGNNDIKIDNVVIDWQMPLADKLMKIKEVKSANGIVVGKNAKSTSKTVSSVDKSTTSTEQLNKVADVYENKSKQTTKNISKSEKLKQVSAQSNMKDVTTSATVENTEVDKQISKVERESATLKAEKEQISASKGQKPKGAQSTGAPSGGGSTSQNKQNLDHISVLPQDNFGLILVNSGVNF